MEQTQFTYAIGDKTYIQRPLVLGQINQLVQLLKGLDIPASVEPLPLMAALGDRLPKAIAIVTIEIQGVVREDLRGRDLDARAGEIAFSIDSETTIRVIEDFFECNPIASLLERLSGMAEKISSKIKTEKTLLRRSASPSPPEISPSETPSSGATPSGSANHT